MKYKICEMKDGNNEVWYQIKMIPRFFWSYWYGHRTWANMEDFDCILEPARFKTKELAQEQIEMMVRSSKSDEVQLMKCEDYNVD